MRSFTVPSTLDPVPARLVRSLAEIDGGRGREELYSIRSPAILDQLATHARIRSVIASSEIEGVTVPRRRAEAVVAGMSTPVGRNEQELAGYRSCLDDVFAHPGQPITVPRLLSWHRLLMAHAGSSVAGHLKQLDNEVVDVRSDGLRVSRFRTMPAAHTPMALTELVERHAEAIASGLHHPVILTAAFVLDLLVIHPFEDGNGRVARIATNALLLRDGYGVCRYVSLEQVVAEHRNRYYDTLRAATIGWHDSTHSIWPWAEFLAEVIGQAYRRLDAQAAAWSSNDVRALVEGWLSSRAPTTFSFGEARRALPSVPQHVLRSVLDQWRAEARIALGGAGRGARWRILDRGR